MTHLLTYREPVTTTYGDLRVGDRVRAGAIGLATVKKTHTIAGDAAVVLGKPGWVAGRLVKAAPSSPITAFRTSTYIRFVSDDGIVQVLDLADEQAEFDGDGDRYATTCTAHSTLVTHRTLALARRHATDPEGWCEAHRDGDES